MKTIFLHIAFLILAGSAGLKAQFSPGELSQAHARLEGLTNCTQCHQLGRKIAEQKCLDCHEIIQNYVNNDRGYHASTEVQNKTCVNCHSEHHGRSFNSAKFEEDQFDHKLTGYTLKGKHAQIEDCRKCHKPEYISSSIISKREGTFLGMGTACLDCHKDYHQGTLDKDCLQCHSFETFEEAPRFDHKEANFVLEGAHQEVDCIKCHAKSQREGKDFQQFNNIAFQKCTDCHDDVHSGKFGTSCTDCHSVNSWIRLKANNKFDHNLTDYPLEGLHQQVSCKECHTSGDHSLPLAFGQCLDCHDDYHQGELTTVGGTPQDCQQCHSVQKPFSYSSYSIDEHQSSSYPLEGAHLATPCFACHKANQDQRWNFDFTSTDCVRCHDNIHKGNISEKFIPNEDCTHCHNTNSWAQVEFDHSTTEWTLAGKHTEVSCRECHFEPSQTIDLGFVQHFTGLSTECITCHNNVHGDQFAVSGATECTRCHTQDYQWKASLFDHSKTEFPLTGKHAVVACKECHKAEINDGGEKQVIYKIESFECIDCHGS